MLKQGSTQSKALKDLWIPWSLVGYSPSVELGVDTELADRDIGAIERSRDWAEAVVAPMALSLIHI